MDNLISYIKSEKIVNEENISKVNGKINKGKFQIQNIENKIVEYTKNIDTTYEIFSPNAYDKDYNIVEIEKLNLKKNEVIKEIESMNESKKDLIEKQKKIELAYDELDELQNQIINNENNTKILIEKEANKYDTKYINEITNILECQINKDNHFVNNEVVRQLDILENKISLCQNFMDIDSNRAKLELVKLEEEISFLKKKIASEMFHVKHFDNIDSNYANLNNEIKNFINQYKKNINSRVDYKYTGEKIEDKKNNITNLIRIIKEAIDNADNHSNGGIININVIVEKYIEFAKVISDTENQNIESVDSEDTNKDSQIQLIQQNNDMHQINFVIEETYDKYMVTVKITDNGEGFKLQDDKILIENDLYGIYLMKYRTQKLNGKFNIQSDIGLGTTVTVIYQTN